MILFNTFTGNLLILLVLFIVIYYLFIYRILIFNSFRPVWAQAVNLGSQADPNDQLGPVILYRAHNRQGLSGSVDFVNWAEFTQPGWANLWVAHFAIITCLAIP